MATEKHKTVLEIGVEDRALRSLGAVMRDTFDTTLIDRHRRAQEGVTKELEKQRKTAEQAARGSAASSGGRGAGRGGQQRDSGGRFVAGAGGGSGGGGGGSGGGQQPMGFMGTAAAAGVGFLGGQALSRGSAVGGAVGRGMGITQSALSAIPIAGPALAGAFAAAEQLVDVATGAGQARASTAGQTGLGNVGGMGMAKYGMSRMDLPSRLAQLAQSSGLRGTELQNAAPGLLRTEALTGVSGGALAGAAGTSGGAVDGARAQQLTEEAIAAGINAGFREARLGQFVQQIAGDIEQLRSRGIMIDPQALTSMVATLGATGRSGLKGEAGLHAAKTAQGAVQGSADRNDFYGAFAMDTVMSHGGGMSAFQAKLALEEDPGKWMPVLMERFGQMGGGDEAKAMALQKWMPGLSTRQAYEMAKGASGGELGPEAAASLADSRDMGVSYTDKEERSTKGAFGAAAAAANFQNKQIAAGEGSGASSGVWSARNAELGIASRTAKYGGKLAEASASKLSEYTKAFDEGGLAGVTQAGMKDLASGFEAIAKAVNEAVQEAVKKAFGMDTETMGSKLHASLGTSEGRDKTLEAILEKIYEWLTNIKIPDFLTKPHRGFLAPPLPSAGLEAGVP